MTRSKAVPGAVAVAFCLYGAILYSGVVELSRSDLSTWPDWLFYSVGFILPPVVTGIAIRRWWSVLLPAWLPALSLMPSECDRDGDVAICRSWSVETLAEIAAFYGGAIAIGIGLAVLVRSMRARPTPA